MQALVLAFFGPFNIMKKKRVEEETNVGSKFHPFYVYLETTDE